MGMRHIKPQPVLWLGVMALFLIFFFWSYAFLITYTNPHFTVRHGDIYTTERKDYTIPLMKGDFFDLYAPSGYEWALVSGDCTSPIQIEVKVGDMPLGVLTNATVFSFNETLPLHLTFRAILNDTTIHVTQIWMERVIIASVDIDRYVQFVLNACLWAAIPFCLSSVVLLVVYRGASKAAD